MTADGPPDLEMLDQPSAGPAGGSNVPGVEVVLTILLFLALTSWGIMDWGLQNAGSQAYNAGQRAAAAHDWERARDDFTAAGSYRDAPDRAAAAAAAIAGRDHAYREAVGAAERGDWLAALGALERVQTIQPGFKDSVARTATARLAVYKDALDGTVAARTVAGAAGLYLYARDAWQRLEGSDVDSKVAATQNCGFIVYDTPADASVRAPTTSSNRASRSQRYLRAAWLADGQLNTFDLDPALSQNEGVICTAHGILVRHKLASAGQYDWRSLTLSHDTVFDYQRLGSPDSWRVIPAADAVVGLDPGSDRLVGVRVEPGSSAGATPISSYYVLQLGSGVATTVYRSTGLPLYARLSPDGTTLLVAERFLTGTGERRGFSVVAPGQNRAPLQLYAEEPGDAADRSTYLAEFISGGPLAGKIVFTRTSKQRSLVWLVDPGSGSTLWTSTAQGVGQLPWWTDFTGGLLLGWHNDDCTAPDSGVTFVDAAYQSRRVDLHVRFTQQLSWAVVAEGRLVYLAEATCWSRVRPYDVVSIDVAALSGKAADTTVLYALSVSTSSVNGYRNGWSFGAGLFAFIRNNELHVCRLDGSADIGLEGDVKALYRLKITAGILST